MDTRSHSRQKATDDLMPSYSIRVLCEISLKQTSLDGTDGEERSRRDLLSCRTAETRRERDTPRGTLQRSSPERTAHKRCDRNLLNKAMFVRVQHCSGRKQICSRRWDFLPRKLEIEHPRTPSERPVTCLNGFGTPKLHSLEPKYLAPLQLCRANTGSECRYNNGGPAGCNILFLARHKY